jgi:hypothetical protein
MRVWKGMDGSGVREWDKGVDYVLCSGTDKA